MSHLKLAQAFLMKRVQKASGDLRADGQRMQGLGEVVPAFMVNEIFRMLQEGTFHKFMTDMAHEIPDYVEANPDLKKMINEMDAKK